MRVLEELKLAADTARMNNISRTGGLSSSSYGYGGRIKVRGLAALVSLPHISYVLENLLRIRVDKEDGPGEIYGRLRPYLLSDGPKWFIGKVAQYFMNRFFGYDNDHLVGRYKLNLGPPRLVSALDTK